MIYVLPPTRPPTSELGKSVVWISKSVWKMGNSMIS